MPKNKMRGTKMKKTLFLGLMPFALTACSSPAPQQSTVPLDTATLSKYQQQVATGTTNSSNSKDWKLNQSDKYRKVYQNENINTVGQGSIPVSVGVGYHRHSGSWRHHRNWW